MTRRKFSAKFKTKVVLEALKERETLSVLGQKYDIHPQQIAKWKKEFLMNAESVFGKGAKSKRTEEEEKKDILLKVIGQQKVEIDFLKNALR